MAEDEGYTFVIPSTQDGGPARLRWSLLPIACAGIDIARILSE